MAADVAGAEAVLYVGVAGLRRRPAVGGTARARPERLWLLGTDGVGGPAAGEGAERRSGRADPLLQHPARAVGLLRLRGAGARAGRDRGSAAIAPGSCARRDRCATATPSSAATRSTSTATRPAARTRRSRCATGRSLGADVTRERFRGALLGLAVGDAVGTTVEFSPPGTFEPVRDMVGGGPFSLPPGAWTDDTSMALCLAESLVERRTFDPVDQLERYDRWYREGYWSSTGRCFDIGNATRAALERFERTREPYPGDAAPDAAGNGPLMKLAPVVLAYASRPDEAERVRGAERADDARGGRGGGRVPAVRAAAARGAARRGESGSVRRGPDAAGDARVSASTAASRGAARGERRRAAAPGRRVRARGSRDGAAPARGERQARRPGSTTCALHPKVARRAAPPRASLPRCAAAATSSTRSRPRCGRCGRRAPSRTACSPRSTSATTRTRRRRSSGSSRERSTASTASPRAGGNACTGATRSSRWPTPSTTSTAHGRRSRASRTSGRAG